MPSKSIFRRPGVKHFQVVHRSQRDPLIKDPEASVYVLKAIEKKGKSRVDLESVLTPEEISAHGNAGEAAFYGIYYDDTEYDYMQHLRPVRVQEDGVESILIEVPVTSKGRQKSVFKSINTADNLELPEGVLPSTHELPRNFESEQSIPDSICGFQPDMDNHLRQVLEALDDEAYVDDNLDDDFFKELVAEGERDPNETFDLESTEEETGECGGSPQSVAANWEKRFADFKKAQKVKGTRTDDSTSEEGDALDSLPTPFTLGGNQKPRKRSSVLSSYSMSGSSMYRNEALQTLDERFDQIMLKEYDEAPGEESFSEGGDRSCEAPELTTIREDFDSMVKQFLNDYEIFGGKMKPVLEGETGVAKLSILRQAMDKDLRLQIDDDERLALSDSEDKKEKWDCETVLTTYTNFNNHPRLIYARDSNPAPKIHLEHRTGLPLLLSAVTIRSQQSEQPKKHDITARKTITRTRNESKEDKLARKATVKQEKQARRMDRKATKDQFSALMRDQKKKVEQMGQRTRKLNYVA